MRVLGRKRIDLDNDVELSLVWINDWFQILGIPGSHKSLVLFQCEMKCEELYIIPSLPRLFKLFLTHISLRCGRVSCFSEEGL
jgi:hypothetical protein